MTTPQRDTSPAVDPGIPELLRAAVAVVDALAAVYGEGAPAQRAQPGHAARITRRGASLRRAIEDVQRAYEEIVRAAARGGAP